MSDAINEPRYPSLKGIMGAKKKPQDVLSLADLGVDAGEVGEAGSRTTVLALGDAARARRRAQDRGRRQRRAGDRRLPRGEEARSEATLVFLEHHGDALQKGSLGVLSKAASLGDVDAVIAGEGAKSLAARGREVRRRRRSGSCEDAEVAQPLPQPRVDVLAQVVADGGYDTVLFANSVLAADVAAGLAARLDAGLNWDLADIELQGGDLVGKRPALQDSVYVDVGWTSTPRLALFRAGSFDATRDRRRRARDRRRLAARTPRTRRRVTIVAPGRGGVERRERSRTPT